MDKIALLFLLLVGSIVPAQTENCLSDSARNRILAMPDDSLKVLSLLEVARLCKYEQTDSAIHYLQEALLVSNKTGYESKSGNIYFTLGLCYYYKQNYSEALRSFYKSLSFAEKQKNKQLIATCYVNIGNQYNWLGNYALAKGYYINAYKLSQLSTDYEMQINLLNNLGIIDGQMGNYHTSAQNLRQAVRLARTHKQDNLIANCLNNLGIAYTYLGQYNRALVSLKEGLTVNIQQQDSRGIANSYSDIGNLYLIQKEYNLAIPYYEKALAEATRTKYVKLMSLIYEKMSQMYEQKGDYKRSFDYYKKYKTINDSLFNQDKTRHIDELNIQYESGKKDLEIEYLRTQNQLKETISKRQSLIITIFFIAVCIFSILSALLYKSIQSKRRVNALLTKQNNLIWEQKAEIESQKSALENYTEELKRENVLAQFETLKNQVNPHFLFNSLNALGSLIKKQPQEAYLFTKEFAKIYRIVLELKEHSVIKLSEELDFIESYLFLQKIRFNDNLRVRIAIPESYHAYVLPPFSIQLAIENAIKHNIISAAQPLLIEVYIEHNAIVIRNNLQVRHNIPESTGVGSKNMTQRYRLISNEIPSFYSDADYFYVHLPLIKDNY